MMKSSAVLLCLSRDMNHPVVQHICAEYAALSRSHSVTVWGIRLTVTQSQCLCSSHLLLLHNGPKVQES